MLDRLASSIVRRKKTLVATFIVLTALCAFLIPGVNVNCDMTKYLPEDMATTKSLKLMEDTFGESGMAQVMAEDISLSDAVALKAEIAKIPGVASVIWLDDFENTLSPIEYMDEDAVAAYYKDGAALFTVQFDRGDYDDRTRAAVSQLRKLVGEDAAYRGSAVQAGLMIETSAQEVITIILWVIPIALIILLFTTASIAEAVLFLLVLCMSVIINMGTNIFLPSISFMTQLSVAVLQMAIAMDYSIFLLDRFAEEREAGNDLATAMRHAVARAFRSISASSTTTIAGFVALMFMSYTIGFDMGLVLAKGIVISLISILFVLPGMALISHKLIERTRHKKLLPKFVWWGKRVTSVRGVSVALWLIIVIPCFLAQNSNSFVYGESAVMSSEGSKLDADKQRIEAVYGVYNPVVLVAPTADAIGAELALAGEIADIDGVTSVQTLSTLLPEGMPAAMAGEAVVSQFQKDGWTRYIIMLDSADEGARSAATVATLRALLGERMGEREYGLVGSSTSVTDIKEVVEKDYTLVNWLSIAMVGAILLITFRSALLPILLILVIESSIWINMAVPYFAGDKLSFIGYMIVSAIQLGATIDYAILLTDRYRDFRGTMDRRAAAREAIRLSGGSIFTSCGILTACGMAVYFVSSIGGISQLGLLIGRGAAISGLMVLFILPQLLILLDRFVLKKKYRKGEETHAA